MPTWNIPEAPESTIRDNILLPNGVHYRGAPLYVPIEGYLSTPRKINYLLALEFLDSWAKGDGEWIIRCWRVLLLHFYTGGRTKYSWEALRLQFQLVFLPPAISHQLKWNCFINTHGGLGRNIPCDLHNEYMNKLFKEIVKNMGPNLTEQAVMWAARSVTALQDMSAAFDK